MTYTQFKARVSEIVQDDGGKLTATETENFLKEAVKTYSKHRPREIVKDITGTGAYDYAIATLLTSWIKGFSVIRKIEYPADEREPLYLDEEDFIVYEIEAGQYLRFLQDAPASTEKIRVTYTAQHILLDATVTISIASPAVVAYVDHKLKPGDVIGFTTTGALPTGMTAGAAYYVISAGLAASAFEFSATPGGAAIITSGTQSGTQTIGVNTIPASDEAAVANLAASLCSGALASAYAQISDSTIAADSVNHRSKSQDYAARAREQKKLYLEHVGIKEGESQPAAAAIADYDVKYPGGAERLTHARADRKKR